MPYDLNFPRASKLKPAEGIIKVQPEDFYVEELMAPDLAQAGEHVWLWVEKTGQNTEYLAGQLAQFAGVKKMDIGFSGLKDRWAVTRQWFSVYLGVRPEPEWSAFEQDGVTILKAKRHLRKLRRGEHHGNHFKILVRELTQNQYLKQALQQLKQDGFPNYFGPQRFGFGGANLERGERYFEGRIKASRSQRSFYLSAARSFLFNINLAHAVINNTWLEDDIGGPLYGDMPRDELHEDLVSLSTYEQSVLDRFPALAKGIHKNRLTLARRAYCVVPEAMFWTLEGDMLGLEFTLPTGAFATSLLSEVLSYRVAQRIVVNDAPKDATG